MACRTGYPREAEEVPSRTRVFNLLYNGTDGPGALRVISDIFKAEGINIEQGNVTARAGSAGAFLRFRASVNRFEKPEETAFALECKIRWAVSEHINQCRFVSGLPPINARSMDIQIQEEITGATRSQFVSDIEADNVPGALNAILKVLDRAGGDITDFVLRPERDHAYIWLGFDTPPWGDPREQAVEIENGLKNLGIVRAVSVLPCDSPQALLRLTAEVMKRGGGGGQLAGCS